MTINGLGKILRLGVLASHGGSNLQSIIDSCEAGEIPAQVCCVISNNKSARALERARKHHIPAYHISRAGCGSDEELDQAMIDALEKHEVELVCLAGYMKLLGLSMIRGYQGRILNIHPALLPEFGGEGMYGIRVHRAVIENGEKESGATVHLVDEIYDHGRILAQRKVAVMDGDTPEELAAKVLVEEHKIYPEVIGRIARGEIKLDQGFF
jgi:phosphoribosylglycinamide formyltransferase 1